MCTTLLFYSILAFGSSQSGDKKAVPSTAEQTNKKQKTDNLFAIPAIPVRHQSLSLPELLMPSLPVKAKIQCAKAENLQEIIDGVNVSFTNHQVREKFYRLRNASMAKKRALSLSRENEQIVEEYERLSEKNDKEDFQIALQNLLNQFCTEPTSLR